MPFLSSYPLHLAIGLRLAALSYIWSPPELGVSMIHYTNNSVLAVLPIPVNDSQQFIDDFLFPPPHDLSLYLQNVNSGAESDNSSVTVTLYAMGE